MGSLSCTRTNIFKSGFIGGKGTTAANALRITSDYGTRKHPITGKQGMHYGIDFGIPQGTQILAPVDGKIIRARVDSKGGLIVTEEYINEGGEKFYICFMHMSQSDFENSPLPQQVYAGTSVIGLSGGAKGGEKSGVSSGPHLHLEIRRGANAQAHAIDPKYFFMIKHYMKYENNVFFDNEGFITGQFGMEDGIYGDYFCAEDIDDRHEIGIIIEESRKITVTTETEFEQPKQKKKGIDAEERLALGVWQITKILFDGDVKDRQVVNANISLQTGSLVNYFNKVCQRPLMEFFGDTFGNQFYWIVRRPPFDKIGFQRMYNYAIDISEETILSKNLQWESQEIYSWYQYLPTGNLPTGGETLEYMPSVLFPEYASIWGSRPLSVQSNYYDWEHSGWENKDKSDNAKNGDRIIQNMLSDFRFLIESNAYRPFSRRGTVTFMGTQNMKRGMLVRFQNGEVFHVDSVRHSYSVSLNSVERTTTIQISHGIFEDYLNEKTVNLYGKVSYFNIIDFGDYDVENSDFNEYQKIISKWKVNQAVFNFFLNRMQLRDKQYNEIQNSFV